MKLEIRKETKPNGDIFYHVYQDDKHIQGYWAGNGLHHDKGHEEDSAFYEAERLYKKIKIRNSSEPIVEIIKSEEL